MNNNFEAALKYILVHEAGFQDDPKDTGNKLADGRTGCTNLGVTQATWEAFVGHPVSKDDMRKLTKEKVSKLYKNKYWNIVHGDDLPTGLDYLMFDFAINAGPGRAIKILQEALGVTVDGAIGNKTLTAINNAPQKELISEFTKAKNLYYKSCKTFPTYGKGWLNRSESAEQTAKTMVG